MIKSSECISFTLSQTYYDYGCWLWFKQELPHILPKISLKRKAKKNSLKLNRLKKNSNQQTDKIGIFSIFSKEAFHTECTYNEKKNQKQKTIEHMKSNFLR